jgi:hypothetical protein
VGSGDALEFDDRLHRAMIAFALNLHATAGGTAAGPDR